MAPLRVSRSLEDLEGAAVILFEGAGPGLVGLLESLLKSSAFEDECGELDGLVGGGSQAALDRRDEPDGGVQADGVAEEVSYTPRFFDSYPELGSACVAAILFHPHPFSPRRGAILDVLPGGFHGAWPRFAGRAAPPGTQGRTWSAVEYSRGRLCGAEVRCPKQGFAVFVLAGAPAGAA